MTGQVVPGKSVQDVSVGALELKRNHGSRRRFCLDLAQVKPLSATQIRKLRRKQKVSQAVFAVLLNSSKATVQQWEQGKKKPGGASLKLLNLVNEKGLDALL